jgi:electron transport complex, rnfABCDGE type, E subunit
MPKKEKSLSSVFMNGIIAENPTLRLVLGTCPTLATTTSATNAIGMGAAATFVLVGSNVVISLLRNIIPDKVRIPAFIAVICTFVTMVQMFMQAFAHELYESLGMFIPLIVVNCIILARAEAFASKNGVAASAADGLGMGLGFTLAITVIGIIREIIGNGTVFGLNVLGAGYEPMLLMVLAPGGFLVFGGVLAVSNLITQRAEAKKKDEKGVIHA